MKNQTIKAGLLALALGTSAWAADGASFLAGGNFQYGMPAFGVTAMGGGMNFDLHFPIKSVTGLQVGMRSFMSLAQTSDFVNIQADGNQEDLDRSFYSAGVAIGPKFKTGGNVYFMGTVGLLVAGNYAVDKTFAANNIGDREILSEQADLSLGGEGSVGFGYRNDSGFNLEFSVVGQGASSEGAPGIMMSIGPKLVFGVAL